MDFKEYVKNNTELYIPYLADKFDLSVVQVCRKLTDMWDMFDNPCMVNNLLHTDYLDTRWHYEVCDTKYKRGKWVRDRDIQQYWLDNQKYDQHVSVFAHDTNWVENVRQTGSVSCRQTQIKSELFWIELDRKDYNKEAHFSEAVRDAQKLRNRILSYDPTAQVWVFSSGNNSTHVAINSSLFGSPIVDQKNVEVFRELAEILTEGLRFDLKRPARKLGEGELSEALREAYPHVRITGDEEPKAENEFKWDAQTAESALEDCDTHIYHTNALIRQPWSWHEKGKERKSLISMEGDFYHEPRMLNIKDQKPTLLHLWFEAWERLKNSKEKIQKKVACDYDSGYILNTYKKHYPEITEHEPDEEGWVGRFHSIFYEDGNPDVTINIRNGYHYDFGSNRYSMSFEDFIIKTKKRYD